MSDAGFTELISPADSTVARTSETVLAYNLGYNGTNFDLLRTETGTTGFLGVGGSVAHDAVDAGFPIKMGGKASSTAPTVVTAGDRVNAWLGLNGQQVVSLADISGNLLGVSTSADNLALVAGLSVNAVGLVYDGTNTDLMRSVAALDASPNVDTGILAVGIGPGYDRKQNPAGVSATSTASAITVEIDGADSITFAFTTVGVTPGSMIVETSGDDGTTWVTSGSVLKLTAETWVSGAFVPAAGDVYLCRTTGLRRIRVRVNAVYASGTVTVKWTASTGVALVKGIDLAPQPHNIGQTVLNYQSASLGVVTSQVAITATAGKRVYITHIRVAEGGTTAGTIAIYSGTGAFTEGTSPTAFFSPFAPSATVSPGAIMSFPVPWSSPNVNEDIRITTTGLTASHVMVQYYIA